MKAKLIAVALILITGAVVVLYPFIGRSTTMQMPPAGQPFGKKIEVVFVLDTTGSMSGLIASAKEKIWSIATTLAQAEQVPEIRIGLVGYRDRGDSYVTQVIDLSSDLDTMYGKLMHFAAAGGGDTPESVNRALYDAVHEISWSEDPSSYQAIFLVGDAPPHMNYQGEAQYPEIVRAAAARGIIVNTIQCGNMPQTVAPWSEIARLGNGRYLQVEQAGGAFTVVTPYDDEIAQLAAQLDGTRLFYGRQGSQQGQQAQSKLAATYELNANAVTGARARRGVFNVTEAGRMNLYGEHDLVENISKGEVTLDSVPEEELPPEFRELEREAQEARVAEISRQRMEIEQRIASLAQSREAFIEERVAAEGGAASSLDRQLFDIVSEQAAPAGFAFGDGPKF